MMRRGKKLFAYESLIGKLLKLNFQRRVVCEGAHALHTNVALSPDKGIVSLIITSPPMCTYRVLQRANENASVLPAVHNIYWIII
jgi:hypothetical protein